MIDLRSDTVTQPTKAMMAALAVAPLGDDVYGEDPTVNALEQLAADVTNKQAALFCPTGSQANLLALLSHCQRGDEYIAGASSHCYLYEAGGGSVLGGIQSCPINNNADGTIDLNTARSAIKPDDAHFARTRLLCIENTFAGKALPLSYLDSIAQWKQDTGLNTHLDGARLFNASVASNCSIARLTQSFDSVSFCLSKGLGAPAGSMLCSSSELIARARRLRKMLGGGMRQAGILAAAGIHALNHHCERLAKDHQHAALLAQLLAPIQHVKVCSCDTNMVFISVPNNQGLALIAALQSAGILLSSTLQSNDCIRLVTHLDLNTDDMHKVANAIAQYFGQSTTD